MDLISLAQNSGCLSSKVATCASTKLPRALAFVQGAAAVAVLAMLWMAVKHSLIWLDRVVSLNFLLRPLDAVRPSSMPLEEPVEDVVAVVVAVVEAVELHEAAVAGAVEITTGSREVPSRFAWHENRNAILIYSSTKRYINNVYLQYWLYDVELSFHVETTYARRHTKPPSIAI